MWHSGSGFGPDGFDIAEKTKLAGIQRFSRGTKWLYLTLVQTSQVATIPLDTLSNIARKGYNIQPKGKQDALLTWYRAEFKLPEGATINDTWRLLINASGNGYIYVNGHNIGRHWEAGRQREYYIPECWLYSGNKPNVIVIGLRQTVNGAVVKAMEIASYTNNAVSMNSR